MHTHLRQEATSHQLRPSREESSSESRFSPARKRQNHRMLVAQILRPEPTSHDLWPTKLHWLERSKRILVFRDLSSMDAFWLTSDFRAAPGSCCFLNPRRTLARRPNSGNCLRTAPKLKRVNRPANQVLEKNREVNFPSELFDNLTIATSWPQLDLPYSPCLPFLSILACVSHCKIKLQCSRAA